MYLYSTNPDSEEALFQHREDTFSLWPDNGWELRRVWGGDIEVGLSPGE